MLFGRLAREPANVLQYQRRTGRAVDGCRRLGRLCPRLKALRNGCLVSRSDFPLQLTAAQRVGTVVLPRGDECAEQKHELGDDRGAHLIALTWAWLKSASGQALLGVPFSGLMDRVDDRAGRYRNAD